MYLYTTRCATMEFNKTFCSKVTVDAVYENGKIKSIRSIRFDPIDPTPVDPTPVDPTPVDPTPKRVVVGYYAEWSMYAGFDINKYPIDKITHLAYAFMLPNPSQVDYNTLANNNRFPMKPYSASIPEGTLVPFDGYANGVNLPILKALKKRKPDLKIIVSVGGWTGSWHMSTVFGNPSTRRTFVKTAVDFLIANDLDGIDIDWEYVGKKGASYNTYDEVKDPVSFASLCRELRQEMDARSPNKHLEISTAASANTSIIPNYAQAKEYLDHMMLMTYDYNGSFSTKTGHLSSFHRNSLDPEPDTGNYAQAAINKCIELGFERSKICIGTPFYGRGWRQVSLNDSQTPLIFGRGSTAAPNYHPSGGEPGMIDYRFIVSKFKTNPAYEFYYDNAAKGHFIYNRQLSELWTYEDRESLTYKCDEIVRQKLGGIIIWSIDADDWTNGGLIDVISSKLLK